MAKKLLDDFQHFGPQYRLRGKAITEAVDAERERCAKIADGFIERTNADIAHAIAAAIRSTK